jgi:hypothetical protein
MARAHKQEGKGIRIRKESQHPSDVLSAKKNEATQPRICQRRIGRLESSTDEKDNQERMHARRRIWGESLQRVDCHHNPTA